MKKMIGFGIVALFFGLSYAHQPRLVFTESVGQLVSVKNPEISQAFYGNLSGQEDIYQIVSNTGFLLYVSIVVPELSGSRTDFMVDIVDNYLLSHEKLEGSTYIWTKFYEKFAGDDYLQGPSFEKEVGPGTYTIKVSNPDNNGKYSLAIGKIESFPPQEMLNTIKDMPKLKMLFFEKSRYTVFRNYVGGFFLVMLLVLFVSVYGIAKLILYIKNR